MSKEKLKITLNSKDSNVGCHGAYTLEERDVNDLVGKLLTLIDALGLPEKQEKSLKDLIKGNVWSSMSSSSYIIGKVYTLARNMDWQLKDEDSQKRAVLSSKDDREKGLHPAWFKGHYELTFTED